MRSPLRRGAARAELGGRAAGRIRGWVLAGAVLTLVGTGGLRGQQSTPSRTTPETATAPTSTTADWAEPAAPVDYRIGPGDLVSVFVYQVPSLIRQLRVPVSGLVELPMMQRPVAADGLTAAALSRALATELDAEGLTNHAQVQVTVRDVQSKPIVVAGAVNHPQTVQAVRPLSVLDAITRAGGLAAGPDEKAGDDVTVTSTLPPYSSYTLTAAALIEGHNRESNPELDGNVIIRVAPARNIYVVGAVTHPGAFSIHYGQELTVLKALSLAQGLSSTESARKSSLQLWRPRPTGPPEVIPVNLNAILAQKSADLTLEPGDILYVPTDGRAKVLKSLASGVGQVAVIALGYGLLH